MKSRQALTRKRIEEDVTRSDSAGVLGGTRISSHDLAHTRRKNWHATFQRTLFQIVCTSLAPPPHQLSLTADRMSIAEENRHHCGCLEV
jgi:hypothetical protein